jgi:hypothetical protein
LTILEKEKLQRGPLTDPVRNRTSNRASKALEIGKTLQVDKGIRNAACYLIIDRDESLQAGQQAEFIWKGTLEAVVN